MVITFMYCMKCKNLCETWAPHGPTVCHNKRALCKKRLSVNQALIQPNVDYILLSHKSCF